MRDVRRLEAFGSGTAGFAGHDAGELEPGTATVAAWCAGEETATVDGIHVFSRFWLGRAA